MAPKLGEVVAAALTFARSSNPQDELFAIAFNDRVQDALPGGGSRWPISLRSNQRWRPSSRKAGRRFTTRSSPHSIGSRTRRGRAKCGLFDANDSDTNPRVLKALARTTGGERFLPAPPGRLLQVCDHIAREIRSGYTLGYAPPDRDGTFQRVRVEIQPSDRAFARGPDTLPLRV